MRHFLFILMLLLLGACTTPSLSFNEIESVKTEISSLMQEQQDCWNDGDLECFMKHYWKSEELMFVGSNIAYGWEKTLENYKKGYPDRAAMGKLTFNNIKIEPAGSDHCFVIGEWKLDREGEDVGGHYSLLWKKNEQGNWVICIDHSS